MHQDLQLFSELCDYLLAEEKNNPVAQPIATSEVYQKLNLSMIYSKLVFIKKSSEC